MFKRIFYLVSLVCIGALQMHGQCSITINGQVKDAHNNENLSFASIYIQETKRDYVADENGKFVVEEFCPGKYHIDLFHIGCETESFFIEIWKDTSIIFTMEHHLELLSEVLVTEHKHDKSLSQASYSLTGEQLRAIGSNNLASMAVNIPGVDMVQSGGNVAKPMIQGLSGNRIVLISDGVVLESQQWGIDHAPEIDGSQAEKLKVIKSSAPILYGSSAMGGVIILDNFKVVEDPHLHGKLKVDYQQNGRMVSASTKVVGKMKDWVYNGQASTRKGGDKSTSNYFLNNTGMEEGAAGFSLGKVSNTSSIKLHSSYFIQNLGILRGSHIGNTTDLQEALGRSIPYFTEEKFGYGIEAPRQTIGHFTLSGNYRKEINSKNSLSIAYNLQQNNRQEFDVRRAGRSDKPIVDLRIISQTADAKWEINETKANTQIGIQLKYQDNDNLPGTGALPLIPDYLTWRPAIYVLQQRDFWTHFHIEYGSRYEFTHNKVFRINQNQIETIKDVFHGGAVNAGMAYFNQHTNLKVDASLIARAPQVNEMYNKGLHQGIAALEYGNENLGLEKSFKLTADIFQSLGQLGNLNLTVYSQWVKDFIFLAPASEPQLTVRGAFLVYNYENADALLRGIDMLHTVEPLSGLEWTNKFSFLRAQNTEIDKELVLTPPLRVNSSMTYHISFSKNRNKSLEFTAAWKYAAKQHRVDDGSDFAPAPDAYHLWDAAVVLHHTLFKQPADFHINISNLLNTSYRDYLNRLRYFADDLGRNIQLGINIKF